MRAVPSFDNRGTVATLDEGRAALARGRPVVLVTPPDPPQAAVLWSLLGLAGGDPSQLTVVVCPDTASAVEWTGVTPPGVRGYVVTSASRAARHLQDRTIDVLTGAADDLLSLAAQSALKLDGVTTVVLAWPEALVATARSDALDTLLGDARQARRVVLTWSPAALKDFLARHAHRAEMIGAPPAEGEGGPLPAAGPAAFAVTTAAHRPATLRDALEALDLQHPFIWNGGTIEPPETAPDGVLCLRLPTREEFVALSQLRSPVFFPTAGQLAYVRSIAAPLTPLRLSSAADRAADHAASLRRRIAERLETGAADADLLLLQPLFDRFDPAEVAAALVGLLRAFPKPEADRTESTAPTWRKIFVKVGSKDGARPKDLVGALIRDAGLAKTDIGRIDVRDTFSVVEVTADAYERALRGFTRIVIRGRRVEAREDRVEEDVKRRAQRQP